MNWGGSEIPRLDLTGSPAQGEQGRETNGQGLQRPPSSREPFPSSLPPGGNGLGHVDQHGPGQDGPQHAAGREGDGTASGHGVIGLSPGGQHGERHHPAVEQGEPRPVRTDDTRTLRHGAGYVEARRPSVTDAASCPQAASIWAPRVILTVALTPRLSSWSRNSRTRRAELPRTA